MSLMFRGRLIGDEQLIELYKNAPAIYTRYFKAYLNYAGKTFIGTKGKKGHLREVLTRNTSLRSGTGWSDKFVNSVANYRLDKEKLEMRAGIIYTNPKKIHKIMELMESGYTKNSNKYMIVPNYKEVRGIGKPIGLFNQMMSARMLRPIFKHGNIYFINKSTGNLMFTGTRHIQVKPQFNFQAEWNTVEPKITRKANSVLDRATKAAEKADLKAKAEIDG